MKYLLICNTINMKAKNIFSFVLQMILLGIMILNFTTCKKDNGENPAETGTVTDIDGNLYKTVKIGSQWWMAENLKVTRYRNGDTISIVSDGAEWSSQSLGAYCWSNNDISKKATYGALYNWYTLTDNRIVAPVGWHIPTDAEWTILTTFLGGDSIAGGKLKSTSGWFAEGNGTDISGFNAIPVGFRDYEGNFLSPLGDAVFWSLTEHDTDYAFFRSLYAQGNDIIRGTTYKREGLSVRCVQDQINN
jgi:uncharacterized protein (TIGR02145 family)